MVDATGRAHESRRARAGRLELAAVSRVRRPRSITELARRFGHNPHVWGWQLDNELSHYDKQYSYSPAATQKIPRMAAQEVRHDRPAEYRLGRPLLVDDVSELRPDRYAQPAGASRPIPARTRCWTSTAGSPRRPPDYLRMQAGDPAPVRRQPVDHHQLHGDARRRRSDAFRARPGRLHLDALPGARRPVPRRRTARLPAGQRRHPELHARFHAAHQRHFGSDGVAAGAGELGRR